MSKGLPRSRSRGRVQYDAVRRMRVRLTAAPITVNGATGVGFGTAVIGDFPEGNILFLGSMAYMRFSKAAASTGIQATWNGNYSIGTVPTADATLAGTEVNIIPSTVTGAATGGSSPLVRGAGPTNAIFDNTDGSLELNLNLLIDDANISADAQLVTIDGILDLIYSVLLDD